MNFLDNQKIAAYYLHFPMFVILLHVSVSNGLFESTSLKVNLCELLSSAYDTTGDAKKTPNKANKRIFFIFPPSLLLYFYIITKKMFLYNSFF